MNSVKGQAAVEYLTTYGWMILVVAVSGGAIFTATQNQTTIQDSATLSNSDLSIEDFGITDSGNLEMIIRASTQEEVDISRVELQNPENSSLRALDDSSITIQPLETGTASLNNVEKSDTKNTFDLTITYDSGSITNLQSRGTLTGPIQIAAVLSERLLLSGANTIPKISTNSSIMSSDGTTLCVGSGCDVTIGNSNSEYVSRSGDNMTGSLRTSIANASCIGNLCSATTGTLEGVVTVQNNTLDGTLNTTSIVPEEDGGSLCVGASC